MLGAIDERLGVAKAVKEGAVGLLPLRSAVKWESVRASGEAGMVKTAKSAAPSGAGLPATDKQVLAADHKPVVLEDDSELWVTLRLRLLNWHYMNFEIRAKTSMHLFTLKKVLQDRHGGIAGLVVCKDAFAAENEMRDEQQTLADCGIVGAPRSQEPPIVVNIYYDFRPSVQEPLLLET